MPGNEKAESHTAPSSRRRASSRSRTTTPSGPRVSARQRWWRAGGKAKARRGTLRRASRVHQATQVSGTGMRGRGPTGFVRSWVGTGGGRRAARAAAWSGVSPTAPVPAWAGGGFGAQGPTRLPCLVGALSRGEPVSVMHSSRGRLRVSSKSHSRWLVERRRLPRHHPACFSVDTGLVPATCCWLVGYNESFLSSGLHLYLHCGKDVSSSVQIGICGMLEINRRIPPV